MKKLLFLISGFAGLSTFSQPVVITQADEVTNLAQHCSYVEDLSGKLTINDVLKLDAAGKFQNLNKTVINFGITHSAFWIKCSIKNATVEKLLLELGGSLLTDIQLYEFDSSGVIATHHSGNWLPFYRREIEDLNFQFKLAALPHTSETIFLRVYHFRGTQFPLHAGTRQAFYDKSGSRNFFEGMYYGIMLLMVLYNLFIYFSLKDNLYLFYVLYVFFMGFYNAFMSGYVFKYLWPSDPILNKYADITGCLIGVASIFFAMNFLHTRQNASFLHKLLRVMLFVYAINILVILSGNFLAGIVMLEITTLIVILCLFATAYIVLRRGYKPARFFLLAWTFLLISVAIFILKDYNIFPYNSFTRHSMQIGSAIEALLLSFALANRINILEEEKKEAHMATFRSLEENKKLITEQNVLLEKKVGERTQELNQANKELLTAIQNLKETQTQLVQREKMASLGELTAGIAHEIQNPLNFINNFSDINTELIEEMKQELQAGNNEEGIVIANEVAENELKINHHGKRADVIVKGMLQHSRSTTAKKELTDINALADEYLQLSYHGLRAKDPSFNATIKTNFDQSLEKINIIPQDIGRVLLNLFNNAFYAAPLPIAIGTEGGFKDPDYKHEPTVWVTTKKVGDKVLISVKDNGAGISQKLIDKIFQPFFTTKPPGQGTGLGLSLSYDIIKAHGGELKVETPPAGRAGKEGEGAEFIIQLPNT